MLGADQSSHSDPCIPNPVRRGNGGPENLKERGKAMTLIEMFERMGIEWTKEDLDFLTAIQDEENRNLVISILKEV